MADSSSVQRKTRRRIRIREASLADIPALIELNHAAYPVLAGENVVWSEHHLRSHQRVFPQGQLVAEMGGKVVGAVSTLVVNLGRDPLRFHTWAGITDGGFFTNPSGGQALSLSDDSSSRVDLLNGRRALLYGVAYPQVHVGSNGYITFTAGDTDFSESLPDHFDTPRVSGLFDDLNPNSAGTVSWRQTADRLAVTWQNVPQYANNDNNTFQIELFFDGRIGISHLSVNSGDAIIGL